MKAPMRRLRDLQPVRVLAGTRHVEAHVLAVEADTAVLGGPGAARLAAAHAVHEVRLAFHAGGRLVALAGVLEDGPIPGTVRFRVGDDAHVPQPRSASRLALTLEATVRLRDAPDDATVAAQVIDVAAGGLGITGFSAEPGARVLVAVRLPPEDRVVEIRARVARTTPDGCGVAFELGEAAVAAAIERFVIACRATLLARRDDAAA